MFKAAINAELLKDAIASLAVIVDEVRFRIKPEGISVKAVDPANVAMVILDHLLSMSTALMNLKSELT
jgi:proliferating cell nuclear antigen